jgi:pimeloyl-ACP methyl ester carboxylesterase
MHMRLLAASDKWSKAPVELRGISPTVMAGVVSHQGEIVARATVPSPRFEGVIDLESGRRISFAEYGRPDGRPVFWFHGTPGARRQVPLAAREAAVERSVRIIALDRPGVGASSPHQYDNLLGWAADVESCADRLGVGRFAAIGLSGGGPYVLACAAAMPDRMVSGAVLGGVAPSTGPERAEGGVVSLAARTHALTSRTQRLMSAGLWLGVQALIPLSDLAFELYSRMSPEGDQLVFGIPGMKEFFIDDIMRGSKRQFGAVAHDIVLFGREWGFALRSITLPIHFWHGDADNIVPLAHGEHMASLVPGAELRVRARESHLGGLVIAEEVLDVLLADWPGEASQSDERARSRPAAVELDS